MQQINCPWCGVRDETEYSYLGEAGIIRPENPDEVLDQVWSDYLYMRKNVKGVHDELWRHNFGCRQYFKVTRSTTTHEIFSSCQLHIKGEEQSD